VAALCLKHVILWSLAITAALCLEDTLKRQNRC
jgi:hypothetical protein